MDLVITTRSGEKFTLHNVSFSADSLRGVRVPAEASISVPNEEIVSIRRKHESSFVGPIVLGVTSTLVFRQVFREHHHHHPTGSCPYIYAYDGQGYQLDAEVFTGSICRSLQVIDYALLESLRMVNGSYRIRIANELPEVQYLDRISLLLVEHDPQSRVFFDQIGYPHTVQHLFPPNSALDSQGREWTEAVTHVDTLRWGSSLQRVNPRHPESLRSRLVVVFDRPEGARSAKLVVRAKNTALAERVTTDLLQLVHPDFGGWLASLDTDKMELANLRKRAAEGLLEIELLGKDDPNPAVSLGMVGPAVERTQVVMLDSLQDSGSTVTLGLNVMAGAWEIDYVGIDYSPDDTLSVSEISPNATSDISDKIVNLLAREDGRYLFLGPGVSYDLDFQASGPPSGRSRSVFVKASGYYHPIPIDEPRLHPALVFQRMRKDPDNYGKQLSVLFLSVYPRLQNTFLTTLLSWSI